MAELTIRDGLIIVDLNDEWSADGCAPAEKRDVIFASNIAQHTANALEKLATMCLIPNAKVTHHDHGPSLEVFCIIHNQKPLVQWKLGRWVKELILSPARAIALAKETRAAAVEVERRAKWLELREPRAFHA